MSRHGYIPGDRTCNKCEEPADCTGCFKHKDPLREEQEALRKMREEEEIRPSFLRYAPHIGCFGCMFWIAVTLIGIGAGIYAIKWAWWFLKYCWNVTI